MRLMAWTGLLGAVVILASGCKPSASSSADTTAPAMAPDPAVVDTAIMMDPVGAPGHPRTPDTLGKAADSTASGAKNGKSRPARGGAKAGRGGTTP